MRDRPNRTIFILLAIISFFPLASEYAFAEEVIHTGSDSQLDSEQTDRSDNYKRNYAQPVFLPDTNRGSQKFFQGTPDRLYLLEEKDTNDGILKIDRTIEVDGVSLDDLYQNDLERN